ncbi:MAG: glutathione S-transferase family protein, partial [Proteobacteria bacterium]|nr:glutathione S-transferase family protein [Pseudomonadota bacterium]
MPTLQLTYFDSPGRAEPIRVALFIAKIPFEDRRLKFPEFGALREQGAFPLGSVPALAVDGRTLVQTSAILRYVARLGQTDLYPADPLAGLIVDSALDTFNDTVSHAMTPSFFERDLEKKLEMRRALVAGPLALACRYVEGLIEASAGPFLTGATLTIADLVLGDAVKSYRSGRLDGLSAETLAPYPK